MEPADPQSSLRDRKLVVLGIPYDVETDELKYYMRKFGELDDCIVMKDRITGQSRGFGYVTFSTAEDARKAAASQHVMNGRMLDVKIATPRDEMVPSASRKVSRIFVARIPPQVTEGTFRSYFQKYGGIIDAYMPKDAGSRTHRGIGFVTFDNAESVDKIMNETHELGGSLVAVDRATPKEETLKSWGAKPHHDQSGKSFPDQWAKSNPDLWAKGLPEQWAKAVPEQWAKMFPEQFGFYMAAAAAAAAQMGAFGGMGGSMEGIDFSSFGFPGFMGMGAEKADNAWNASEGAAVKSVNAQVNDSPGGGGGPNALPSPTTGYASQSSAPQNAAPAASGYDPEAAQSNAASAYGSAALLYSMFNPENGYGTNAPTTSMTPATYASASQGMNSAGGYGQNIAYSTASTAPGYGASGYYGSAVGHAASTAQPYGSEQGSGAPASGASYPGAGYASGAFLYSGAPSSGHEYDNSISYAPVSLPDSGYGSSASYAGLPPMSGTGYGSNILYGDTAARYGSNGPPVATMGNKVFIGKLPHEATAEHLRNYFSSFGRILDVYVPKDAKKTGHRGFGFVTFFDDGVAERVAMESHEILGQPIAVDRPTPQDSGANFPNSSNPTSQLGAGDTGSWGGNAAGLQRTGPGGFPATFEYSAGGLGSYASGQSSSYDGAGANRMSRPDVRYRPY
eukprot:c6787_g1_i1 orf=290-2326(+)